MSHRQRRARRRGAGPVPRPGPGALTDLSVPSEATFGLGAPAALTAATMGGIGAADLMSSPGLIGYAGLAAGAGVMLLGYRQVTGRRAALSASGFADRRELASMRGDALVKRRGQLRHTIADVPADRVSPDWLGWRPGNSLQYGFGLWVPCEDGVVLVGPPRSGKTAMLGNSVLDAHGPVLCTSTKPDLMDLTAGYRGRKGGKVWVFDADEIVEDDPRWTKLHWPLVAGCTDMRTAIRRAGYLISGSGGAKGMTDKEIWEESSHKALKGMLWAAAYAGLGMDEVAAWSNSAKDQTPLNIMAEANAKNPGVVPRGWDRELKQVLSLPDKTRDSVYLTLSMSTAFMSDPSASGLVRGGDGAFDVDEFLLSAGDTLYMIGEDRERGGVGPLFSALAGEVFNRAKELALRTPNRRLDPTLRMVLDEAALICPVPLPQWSADSGGRGITLHVSVQSPAQLYDTWTKYRGQIIWSNLTQIVLGGLAVMEHLEEISKLCGERTEVTPSTSNGPHGRSTSYSERKVPVMSPADVRMIPAGNALLLPKKMRPVMIEYTPAWDHPAMRRWQRDQAKHARAQARKARKDAPPPGPVAVVELPPPAPEEAGPAPLQAPARVPAQAAERIPLPPPPAAPPAPVEPAPVQPATRIAAPPPGWPMPVRAVRPVDPEETDRGRGEGR
jgi:type IV secretion system protein VirD4